MVPKIGSDFGPSLYRGNLLSPRNGLVSMQLYVPLALFVCIVLKLETKLTSYIQRLLR